MDDENCTVLSVGLYDNLYQCDFCGYKFCQSIDSTKEENEQRASHQCKGDGFEIIGS